jgi:hypothetical protein
LFWLRGERHRERRAFDKRAGLEPLVNDRAAQSAWISAAVPVIAIPLAFRRAAACAVEATNGPAVQSLTWTPPPPSDFLPGKNRTEPPVVLKLWKMEKSGAHRCALPAKFKPGNGDFDRSPPALHPPFMALPEGVSFACCLFVV